MDYEKMSEQRLDEIMQQIRGMNQVGGQMAATPQPVVPAQSSVSSLSKMDEPLANAVIGKQIGLYKAPMHRKRGLLRLIARLVEKVYLRVAELSNRDIREFNGFVLTLLHQIKGYLSELFGKTQALEQQTLNLTQQIDDAVKKAAQENSALGQKHNELRAQLLEQKQMLARLQESAKEMQASFESRLQSAVESRTAVMVEQYNQAQLKVRQLSEQVGALRAIVKWTNNAQFTQDVQKKLTDTSVLSNPVFYHDFEERFRGTQQDIHDRLTVYLPVLKARFASFAGKRMVDIGCGRGEWMDLLRENGADNVTGVDLNEIQLDSCREKGHHVVNEDCLAFLAGEPDESVDLVSGFQIIEHLALDSLLQLLGECRRVLRPGGIILFETPNSMNLITAAVWFNVDPTHIKPIHKDVARFLVERSGFCQVDIIETNPAKCVKTLVKPTCFDGNQPVWDENIDLLNGLMYGPQDYAVLGVKQ